MEKPKTMGQRLRRTLRKAPGEFLPARVQKSCFMLSSAERNIPQHSSGEMAAWPGRANFDRRFEPAQNGAQADGQLPVSNRGG